MLAITSAICWSPAPLGLVNPSARWFTCMAGELGLALGRRPQYLAMGTPSQKLCESARQKPYDLASGVTHHCFCEISYWLHVLALFIMEGYNTTVWIQRWGPLGIVLESGYHHLIFLRYSRIYLIRGSNGCWPLTLASQFIIQEKGSNSISELNIKLHRSFLIGPVWGFMSSSGRSHHGFLVPGSFSQPRVWGRVRVDRFTWII